jgi:uncharacterized DUF497 family protein
VIELWKIKLGGLNFDWDDKKSEKNLKDPSRGFDFQTAANAFFDEWRIGGFNRFEDGEVRLQIIGRVEGVGVIQVVYTVRSKNGEQGIRIISARYASRKEREAYLKK